MRKGRAVAALAAFSLAAGALGACGGQEQPAPRAAAISGLAATLEDQQRRAGDTVDHTTYWELRWRPVPGAKDYLVSYVTIEGTSSKPEAVRNPHLRLSAARGISRPGERFADRRAQLSLAASQLSVVVAARYPDGSVGPRSQPLPVGEALPG